MPSDNPECGFDNELCEWLNSGMLTLKIILKKTNKQNIYTVL